MSTRPRRGSRGRSLPPPVSIGVYESRASMLLGSLTDCSSALEALNYEVCVHDVAERQVERNQRRIVLLVVGGGVTVAHHDGAEIQHHGVARSRLAADVGDG